jgi:hypothetical protein
MLVFATPAFAEQYLCTPDAVTGFVYRRAAKRWVTTQFNKDFKYLIASSKNGRDAYTITKSGERDPDGYCQDDFNDAGYLFCSGFTVGDFNFNRRNGRYLIVFTDGYYSVGKGMRAATDEESGTPSIEIGKCTPF